MWFPRAEDAFIDFRGHGRRFCTETILLVVAELESPEVLVSDAWARVVDKGRWPGEVRPYTSNRRHVMYRRLEP